MQPLRRTRLSCVLAAALFAGTSPALSAAPVGGTGLDKVIEKLRAPATPTP